MKRGDSMTCFTDAECLELLPQLKAAYVELTTGSHKSVIKYRDRTVTYSQANMIELKKFMNELDGQCGCNKGRASRLGPLKVRYCG